MWPVFILQFNFGFLTNTGLQIHLLTFLSTYSGLLSNIIFILLLSTAFFTNYTMFSQKSKEKSHTITTTTQPPSAVIEHLGQCPYVGQPRASLLISIIPCIIIIYCESFSFFQNLIILKHFLNVLFNYLSKWICFICCLKISKSFLYVTEY